MLLKLKCQAYVGFDEGTQAVLYYNAAMCKVLTSRNFHHLNVPKEPSSPEEIVLVPTLQHEGELGRQNMPQVDATQSGKNSDKSQKDQTHKHKCTSDDKLEVDMNKPQQT
jgi:hypothetical protein